VAFGLLWAAVIGAGWRARRAPGVAATIGLAVVATAVPAVVMQGVFPYFTSPGFPHVMAVLLGLLATAQHDASRRAGV
jgi:hypothetical protein